jgi:hypothetical protein
MRIWRRTTALSLFVVTAFHLVPPARACGPATIDPIFVFQESPDLPFAGFTRGQLGIVKPSFGRKTLAIAYRYLNGGSFNEPEQAALVEALRGKAIDEGSTEALKNWVEARKELLKENETLPEIYLERKDKGYDFFPNCAKNAFEVATATLKDRVSSYGSDDRNVRDWMAGQDVVFENCSGGAKTPDPAGSASPVWLRKDRDYQIAAAFFYSLNFDEARRRFELIASDLESPWRETARYLVARTLVRQASLTRSESLQRELYEKAEVELQNLIGHGGNFQASARRFWGLIQYRLHPEDRVQELGRKLATWSGNEDLGQDLIDYVWLLDRFESQSLDDEEKRREALKPPEERNKSDNSFISEEAKARYEAINSGELISIDFTPKTTEGQPDHSNYTPLDFKPDVSESEILLTFESKLNRKLGEEEIKELRELHQGALEHRDWLKSPNRKWGDVRWSVHEGCNYDCEHLTLDLVPAFLRNDDLSDWILTLQTEDPNAYSHAFERWRATESGAWLAVALIKAAKTSPHVTRLMREAQRVGADAPEFPTVAHELVRLQISLGDKDSARSLVDQVISRSFDLLSGSARNEFLEQRTLLAKSMTEFLKFSQRKPVAFNDYGRIGTLADLLQQSKASWDAQYSDQTKEEYEKQIENTYRNLLPWDERFAFDEESADILNWDFPSAALVDAARDQALPDYLQRQLILAAWTRAILFERHDLASQITPDLLKVVPEMTPVLKPYVEARTPAEKKHAALFVLLRFPNLSPFVKSGIPDFSTSDSINYYFESAWWCTLPVTEYDRHSQEIPKVVQIPDFLTAKQMESAAAERAKLKAIGDAKRYLGRLVLDWARASPGDSRIPEALYIAFNANGSYKYGCGGWEHDDEVQRETSRLLREKYPNSPWTARLPEPEKP